MSRGQLVVNERHVVFETIDDETVLIHLGTGVYYSLDQSGTTVWSLVARGVAVDDIVDAVRETQGTDGLPEIEGEIRGLVERLTEEELLVPGVPPERPGAGDVLLPPAGIGAPVLQRYTDMQEFMMVDPLHEVDEQAGWPNVKSG